MTQSKTTQTGQYDRRRTAARRTAWIIGACALAVYVAFMLAAVF